MDPYHPVMSGVVQNQDSYMKGKIAQRSYTDKVESNLINAMDEFFQLTGRRYELIDTCQIEDAEYVLVGMGTMTETAQACINYIRNEKK